MTSRQLQAVERPWSAVLICPDRQLATELAAILPDQMRVIRLAGLVAPPAAETVDREISRHQPDLCFLDCVSSPEQAFETLSRLAEKASSLPVIALVAADEPEMVLRCLRRGAAGVLLRPFGAEQLEPLLRRIADLHPKAASRLPKATARVYCVLPAKGSSGATTVASNLACQARAAGIERVLLADMDPLASTLSFQFKLQSQYSFLDALSHASELDGELWKALVTDCRGVDVLPSPEMPSDGAVEGQDAIPLVEYARRHYQLVFFDLGSPYGAWNAALAQASDEVLVVVSPEVASVYSARRTLTHLERQSVARGKTRIVVNRHRREAGLEPAEIEEVLGMEVLVVLPSDPEAIDKALMEGRPVASNSQLGKALSNLLMQLGCCPTTARKAQRGNRLFSLFSR